MGIASDLVYIVLVSLGGALLAMLFRQPLLVGYIAAGIILGPHTGGITIHDINDVERLAEIGIALLLFTIGLELSFKQLREVRAVAVFGTIIQMTLCGIGGFFIASMLGLEWQESLWFGCIISASSTMVVLKTLGNIGIVYTLSSRVTLGMLIMQDLAIVLIMLILPQVTQNIFEIDHLLLSILKSLLFIAFMYIGGMKFFPKLFTMVARLRSRELSFIFTLAVALGIGYAAFLLGLSFPCGAFVAGMVLSETDFRHQALSDVASLRDLFGLLFFVSIGMLLDPWFFIAEWKIVLTVLCVILLLKALVTGAIVRLFGYKGDIPVLAGIGLSQIGEFSFAVASEGLLTKNISPSTYSLIISVAVLSMALTPVLFQFWERLSAMKPGLFQSRNPVLPVSELTLTGQEVVIAGGGVVGEHIARVLAACKINFIIIEIDHQRVLQLRRLSYPVIYGDAAQRHVLEAAGAAKAKLLIIASPNSAALSRIIRELKDINPTLPIVARVEEEKTLTEILKMGIKEIVQPKLEASLELVRQSLLTLGAEDPVISNLLDGLRERNYATILSGDIEKVGKF